MRNVRASKLCKGDAIEGVHRVTEVIKVGDYHGEDGVTQLAGLYVLVTMRFEADDGAYFQETRTWYPGDEIVAIVRCKASKG
jgi:hypothetical protein